MKLVSFWSIFRIISPHKNLNSKLYNNTKFGYFRLVFVVPDPLIETLQKKVYVINTYNWCVENKEIEEKKCTIVWYVDDNNASHMNPKVIDDIISDLKVH